jgi:hypothetical protein
MAKKSVPLGVSRPAVFGIAGEFKTMLRAVTEIQKNMEKKHGPPPAGHINSKDLERIAKESEKGEG